MPRLSDIQQPDIRPVPVVIGGVELNFDIDMSAFTIGWQRRMAQAVKESDIAGVATNFFALVKKWDVTDDDGTVLPLDESAFDQLSVATFGTLTEKIMEKLDPNAGTPAQKKRK